MIRRHIISGLKKTVKNIYNNVLVFLLRKVLSLIRNYTYILFLIGGLIVFIFTLPESPKPKLDFSNELNIIFLSFAFIFGLVT